MGAVTGQSVSAVRLQLLGGFEFRVNNAIVDIKPAPQRLLAMLALSGAALQRTFAASQLWPDTSRERAQANLRTTIWRLRSVPGELVCSSKTHVLGTDVWVDVRDGLDEAQWSDPNLLLRYLRSETTLLADLLPDWYDDWVETERERIRQLHLAGLERGGEVLLAAGEPAAGDPAGPADRRTGTAARERAAAGHPLPLGGRSLTSPAACTAWRPVPGPAAATGGHPGRLATGMTPGGSTGGRAMPSASCSTARSRVSARMPVMRRHVRTEC